MSVNEIDDLHEVSACVLDNVALRDAGALAAAVGRPRVTILDVDAYPNFDDKAASLLYSLVRNHALVDGNQRLAWASTRVIRILNGRDLSYSVDDAEALMLAAAAEQATRVSFSLPGRR